MTREHARRPLGRDEAKARSREDARGAPPCRLVATCLLLVPLALSLLVGCGRAEYPLTSLSLAIIAESEVGEPRTAVRDNLNPFRVEDVGVDAVGVELRYPGRTYLNVVLLDSLGAGVATCETLVRQRCVVTASGTLLWNRQSTEDGPGSVGVVVQQGSQFVVLEQRGPVITGDPRDQELPISVEEMMRLAADDRIATRTSQPEEPRDYFDDSPPTRGRGIGS